MKVFDYILLFFLLVLLAIGSYLLYLNFYGKAIDYEVYETDLKANNTQSIQFYSNLRYRDRSISYLIEDVCNVKKEGDVREAFDILERNTILSFYESKDNPEIVIFCSGIAPEPGDEEHFVAGEGGPNKIIESGKYHVVLSGKVSLFRNDKCDSPQIALHEILHALGFDHINNKNSILYPVTDCKQEVDNVIVNTINEIYSDDSKPDLLVESIEANSVGRYLSFEISVLNAGLKDAGNSSVVVISGDKRIKEFDIGELDIGTKRVLSVENLWLTRKYDSLVFTVDYYGSELSKENNVARIVVEP